MKKISDGWHIICGFRCYVEDGCIIRATKPDTNGSDVTAFPYRKTSEKYGGGWDNASGISVAAFRAAYNRGTANIF